MLKHKDLNGNMATIGLYDNLRITVQYRSDSDVMMYTWSEFEEIFGLNKDALKMIMLVETSK